MLYRKLLVLQKIDGSAAACHPKKKTSILSGSCKGTDQTYGLQIAENIH
jgi:hypothetical protein